VHRRSPVHIGHGMCIGVFEDAHRRFCADGIRDADAASATH
jgi:hypothetical protein